MQSPDANEPKSDLGIKIGEPESTSRAKSQQRAISNTLKFLATKALLIGITIFLGVFMTVSIID